MKRYTKVSLFFVLIIFTSFFLGKKVSAAGTYADEGTGFYAQTSPSGYSAEGIAFYAYDPTATQPSGTVAVYRYYNSSTGDHFYATSNSTPSGYKSEGTSFYAYSSQATGTVPVYRFYNSALNKHFYTASQTEYTSLLNNPQWGYAFEDIEFYAYDPTASQPSGAVPVYRFYDATTGDHFYTASVDEKNSISQTPVYRFYNPSNGDHFYTASQSEQSIVANTSKSGYVPEGTAFYAYSNQISGTSPVYRFYDAKTGDHFYTISEDEKSSLISNTSSGYTYENIAFYAYSTQVSGTTPIYRLYDATTNDHLYTASVSERTALLTSPLGPQISVGLWEYEKSDISSSPFQITADEPYNIVNSSGTVIGQVSGNNTTKVEYDSNNNLKIYDSISSTDSNTSVSFVATSGDPGIIFDVNRPSSSYDHYRGSIKLQYYHGNDIYGGTSSTVSQVWVINTLPLEEYVWGAGETTGTGPDEHTKVMATIFRTYGFWYIKYATKYAPYGFQIRSDSGSQVYWGEDWESNYSNIKKNAQATRGVFATYKSDVALTPYSSWSAGKDSKTASKTLSYKEVWGSSSYPWCKSVSDPYGDYNNSYFGNSTKKYQSQLISEGNHMVGLIAHGSLELAGSDHNWSYSKILKYYYTGISLPTNY